MEKEEADDIILLNESETNPRSVDTVTLSSSSNKFWIRVETRSSADCWNSLIALEKDSSSFGLRDSRYLSVNDLISFLSVPSESK